MPLACETAECLAARGVRAGVVNARYVKPIDIALLAEQATGSALIVTLENGALAGGFGSAVRETLAELDLRTPVRAFGWPDRFVGQGTSAQLREAEGLVAARLAETIRSAV